MELNKTKEIKKEVLHQGKWLALKKIYYTDPNGTLRDWETCERQTRKGPVDAVDILATLKSPEVEDRIILVKQYRPPLGKICIEFPAGLVDEGETPEQAALRELKEETGYEGKVLHASAPLSYEPGMSNTTCSFVHVEVLADANQGVRQHLDDGEFIEIILVPRSQLLVQIQELAKNHAIDAKVYVYAYTLQMCK